MTDEPTTSDLDHFFPKGSIPLWNEFYEWCKSKESKGYSPLSIVRDCYDRGLAEGRYQGSEFGPFVPWESYHELWEKMKRLTERVDALEQDQELPTPDFASHEKEIQRRIAAAVEAERERLAGKLQEAGWDEVAAFVRFVWTQSPSVKKEVKP